MTQQADTILVTGATGNTGRALVDALARRGAPVRAMVRAEADRGRLPAGVPAVVADFDDPASIAAALEGAGRACWRTTRTTGAARPPRYPPRSPRSPAGRPRTSGSSPATTPRPSPAEARGQFT